MNLYNRKKDFVCDVVLITENDVIESVSKHLCIEGYTDIKTKGTSEQGYDISAIQGDKYLYIEAKGQTSSKPHTRRFGKEFTSNQKQDHVAKAVYAAMKTLKNEANCEVGIALPGDLKHIELVSEILPSLEMLKIRVFFVSSNGTAFVL